MANNLELKLNLALDGLEKGVAEAKAQIKSLGKEKADIVIDIRKDRLNQDLSKVKAELNRLADQQVTPDIEIKREQALNDILSIKRQLNDLDALSVDVGLDVQGGDKIKNLIAEIKTGIGREIGSQIFQGLSQIPAQVAQTTLQFEKLQTVLKTTLGSQSEADKAFALIKDFAASTPFQVSSITDAFIKLTNRGVKPTRESLTQLGDLASSQGKELDQLVEAILDASTGENERLKEFGIQAQKSGDQVTFTFKGVQKTVANTPEAINAAILSFGELQGVAGGMEAQSKTLGGALSNLQDVGDTLAVAFGQELAPILLEIVKGFSESGASAEGFAKGAGQNVGNAIKFLVDNGNALKTVLELVAIQFGLTKAAAAATSIELAIAAGKAAVAAGGFAGLAASLQATAASAALAAGPLLVFFAAYKTGELIIAERNLREFNDQLDSSARIAENTGNQTFKLAQKLQSLREARQNGRADLAQEKGFLELSKKQLADVEKLKKEQQDLASQASDPSQKQAFLNVANGYEIEANALKKQIAELENVAEAKKQVSKATKEQIKDAQDEAKELAKIAKQKADIDAAASKKRSDLIQQERQKAEEEAITDRRDSAINSLEEAQKKEIGDFQLKQENEIGDRKLAFEQQIADFKDSREAALEDRKRNFEKSIQSDQDKFRAIQESKAEKFQDAERAKAEAFQKQQQEARKAFEDRLSGAKSLVDREGAIGTAETPEAAAKLKAKFAEEDRIRQQVLSTNVDPKASKEQFAQQAKQIAGVGGIRNQEDLAKVQFALAELEAKAKAQFAEEERAKQSEFEATQQEVKRAFREEQNQEQKDFEASVDAAKLDFERDVLKPEKAAIEAEIEAKKIAFERGTLQPLKLQQEEELGNLKKSQEEQLKTLKLGYEQEIADLKKQFKLEEIDLDAKAQKERLDKEAAFRDEQRKLDLAVAAKLSGSKTGANTEIPKFSKGVQNFGGGLAYVHAGEMLMNLSRGTSVIPANQVKAMNSSNNSKNYSFNITSAKDPNALIGEALKQMAVAEMRRNGN